MWNFFSRDSSKEFPFEIGENIEGFDSKSIFTLYKANSKSNNLAVSVFSYDIKNGNNTQLDEARTSLKRLKTLRHPAILQYIDSTETDKFLYITTECVEPLYIYLAKHFGHFGTQDKKEIYLSWGFFQVTRALSFLINDGKLNHNNISSWSVFVNKSGEWKLGGLEYVTVSEREHTASKPLNFSAVHQPPELFTHQTKTSGITKWSTDMWALGCLIWEAFNGELQDISQLKEIEKIPKSLAPILKELVDLKPQNRPNPADVITRCRKPSGFYKNDLVDTLLFLEEIHLKDKSEKTKFFNSLQLECFPEDVCKYKILPQLVSMLEYGDAGPAVLTPLFKLGRLLEASDYQKKIIPSVVKLFASSDRITRSKLLQQLEMFINHIQPHTINEQIFPHVIHGFLDTNPTIREQTIKAIIHLAPKLNYNNLNVEVLRHFARLQSRDDQGAIRTNTTVCLGKIAPHLHPQVRQRVLVSAFIRAMRDPFPPARIAGVLALAATQQYFLLVEVSNRILPAISPLTTDPEKSVRDPAFKTIRGFLGKLEKVSDDPSLRETMEADVNTATPSLSNAAATWAGWAVTAVTAKFYRSQSDTAHTRSITGNTLVKPASLEQPSSSSISTTTSSVTSMTSLEHESNETSASVSDYGIDNWEHGNWGEMDASQDANSPNIIMPANPTQIRNNSTFSRDGWDNDEWGSLEEENEEVDISEHKINSKESDPFRGKISNNNKCSTLVSEEGILKTTSETIKENWNHSDSWTDGEFEPVDETFTTKSRSEESRQKREEKKLQRQRELEERRAARSNTVKGLSKGKV